MILTGIAIGGNIPLAMGDIINFKGIGPEYVGTASGLVATIQLIGAVVLPSYVLIPIASGNFNTLFILQLPAWQFPQSLGTWRIPTDWTYNYIKHQKRRFYNGF